MFGFAIFFYFLLLLILGLGTKPGSDHYFHVGLIKLIKNNGNRFLTKRANILPELNLSYPQFLHWIISFFPIRVVSRLGTMVTIFMLVLSLILLIGFTYFIMSLYSESNSLAVFMVATIYIVMPYSYAYWNAKNVGVSARGFGILLVHLYCYCLIFLQLEPHYIYYFGISFISLLLILSSQFGAQFILLSAIPYSVLFADFWILLSVILGVILFRISFGEVAKSFFQGQYWHKQIYSKYLADVFILKVRPSIYRDFVYDFWRLTRRDIKKALWYLFSNPLINVLKGFPIMIVAIIYLVTSTSYSELNDIETILFKILIGGLVVFFLTSLRKTRFLGEPDRYLELLIPFITIWSFLILKENQIWFYVSLIATGLLFILEITISSLYQKKYALQNDRYVQLKKNISTLKGEKNVFSNNSNLLKTFLDDLSLKVLIPNITFPRTGSIPFEKLFPKKYGIVSSKAIPLLIDEFNINVFILDKSSEGYDEIELSSSFRCIDSLNQLDIYYRDL